MLKTNLVAVALSFCIVGLAGKAYANSQDVAGQICQKHINGGGTVNYDTDGIRNDSTTQTATVDCPMVVYSATGRSLYIGGTDQNSLTNFSCSAFGWDVNLATVSMPSITITTGTYTNGTVGSFSIPDSVVKLVIQCVIPIASSQVSKISDFYIQN